MHATPRPPVRATFNLIEIILALVIVLLGIISIMALFPVGQKASSDAINRTSAGDAGDQFLQYYASQIKTRWALVNALPLSKPGADEGAANWQANDLGNVLTGVQGLVLYYDDQDNDGKYDFQIKSPTDVTRDESGLFKLEHRTDDQVVDFTGVIRVWKTAATYSSYSAAGGSWTAYKPVPPDAGITLNVEVSWPEGLPYAKREKAVYSTSVYRPSEVAMEEVKGAFRISETGKLRVTYHGSDAGWVSSLHMIEPVEQQLFASNQRTEQVTTWDVDYPAGTLFNFYIQTVGKCCGYGTYKHFAWAPEPPGCDCTCRGLEGSLNINPNNSPDNEFTLVTAGGRTITRDDLHSNSAHDGNGVFYSGKATAMRVKPKGNGNQNTLLMDGVVYLLENKETYTIEGDLDVVVYNDRVNSGGKCMGHWWVNTGAGCAKVRKNTETHDERCPQHPANAAALAASAIPYFDNPTSSYHGAYDKTTGNPYCMVTEVQPGREWLLRFEDLPGAGSDWDYNDVVISVELLKNDGVTASVQHVPLSGTVDLNRGTGWRASVVLADGTMMTDGDMRAYDGKVASLWFRPQGSGSQTISVNGSSTAFSNASMVSLCSADMTVRIYQSGSTWKADFSTTKGFYTVFQ